MELGNHIFKELFDEKVESFKRSFQKTAEKVFKEEGSNKLYHPGEFGSLREDICRSFLRLFIPMRLDIGTGFIINSQNEISTQCDLIVYDRNSTPLIENKDKHRFFPVETLSGIVEIKSNLSKTGLKTALNKMARTKILRDKIFNPSPISTQNVGHFDPKNNLHASIFSILICNKLEFDLKDFVVEIDDLYEKDINPWHKHNLILSIEDGLFLYKNEKGQSFMYPYLLGNTLPNRFVAPNDNPNIHFYLASTYVFTGTTSNTIYYPDIADYLSKYLVGGTNFDVHFS